MKTINVKVTCQNEFERKAILRAIAMPEVYTFLILVGVLSPLKKGERQEVVDEVMRQLMEKS